MNKVFGYIFTGIGFLVIIATILMIVFDEPYFGTMPEFNYLDYYLFPIIFTVFPIGIGRFLIYGENNWKNLLDPAIEKRIREAFPEEMKELG